MRKYFFSMNTRGLVFNDEFIKVRNIATALKDPSFIDFTIRRLRPSPKSAHFQGHDYPLVSPCQGELNYVRCLDDLASLVFSELENSEMTYGASLKHCFKVEDLSIINGFIYHKITDHKFLGNNNLLGILAPKLAYKLSNENLHIMDNGDAIFKYQGKVYNIQNLDTA